MPELVWFITGCSSGFGEQFVHSIVARGDKVIATARNIDKIKHLESAGASILQLDITDEPQRINDTIAKAIEIYGRVDVLVNNAGYVAIGHVEDVKYEDYLAQFNTNVFGSIKVTQAILPHFRSRSSGTLLFVSSLSGWVSHPGVSPYAGSKFALEAVAEAIRGEVADLGIKTLLIEPGRFRTKLLSTDNLKAARTDRSKALFEGVSGESGKQPGDPVKLVEIMVDLVRGEGVAAGREVPFRLPVGVDCYDEMKAKLDETQKVLEDWKDVIRSTDYKE